jgi:hypothetical protein
VSDKLLALPPKQLHAIGIQSEIIRGVHAVTGKEVRTIRLSLLIPNGTVDLVFDDVGKAALFVSGFTSQLAALLDVPTSEVQVARALPFA